MKLLILTSLLFLATCTGGENFDFKLVKAEHPSHVTNTESFRKFLQLTEEHNLNITVILSAKKAYNSGAMEEALSISLPPNEIHPTISKLEIETGRRFLENAIRDQLPAKFSIAEVEGTNSWTNMENGVPDTRSHELLKSVATKFEIDATAFTGRFEIYHENGLTRAYLGNFAVKVVEKLRMSDVEIDIASAALMTALFQYEDGIVPRALVALLRRDLPGNNWQAARLGQEYCLRSAQKWVVLESVEETYAVFST